MDRTTIKKNNNLLNTARTMRKNMTRQQKHLWYDFLQHYPIKVYKHRIIENYIVDFYCHQARLIIEIDDAPPSAEKKVYEMERALAFAQYGLAVLRFTSKEIDGRFFAVCRAIDNTVKVRMTDKR